MKKFYQLQSVVQATDDQKLMYFVRVLGVYLQHLSTYYEILRVQEPESLREDLEIFSDYIAAKPEFRGQLSGDNKRLSASILMDDVAYIARHVFEAKDVNGNIITGDDLHHLAPDIFEGESEMSLEEIVDHLTVLKHAMV
ncbi:MAG: hypothetical protein Q8Q67_03680 [bacterium]|nr:hypothetical protein [bacterium]